jgi:hypothetical protein
LNPERSLYSWRLIQPISYLLSDPIYYGFYTGDSTLTPHRQSKSHTGLTETRMKTKEFAQDVQDDVEQDFTLHYRVTDTDQFLNKLLPALRSLTCSLLHRRFA